MFESYLVLMLIDDENETYYVKRKNFAAGSLEARITFEKQIELYKQAGANHYKIKEYDRILEDDNEPRR